MQNNKKETQAKSLKDALIERMEKPESGELPDDVLNAVSGGAVLDSMFHIARCKKCGWQSPPFDNHGAYDLDIIVLDHCSASPECEGDFAVFNIDSRNVKIV